MAAVADTFHCEKQRAVVLSAHSNAGTGDNHAN